MSTLIACAQRRSSWSALLQICIVAVNHTEGLLPPLLHGQDLDHPDEDVDEVQLEVDGLVDGILGHEAALGHACVMQDLLDIVQSEAAEDGKTAVQPDVLSPHQSAGCGCRNDHGGEAGESNNGNTGEERAAEVHVLVGFRSGADECERAHQASSVETGTCEDGGVHEEERGEEGGLSDVEGGPQGVLLDIAVCCQCVMAEMVDGMYSLLGAGGHGAIHGTNASSKTNTHDHPRIGGHEPE